MKTIKNTRRSTDAISRIYSSRINIAPHLWGRVFNTCGLCRQAGIPVENWFGARPEDYSTSRTNRATKLGTNRASAEFHKAIWFAYVGHMKEHHDKIIRVEGEKPYIVGTSFDPEVRKQKSNKMLGIKEVAA